MRYRLLCTACGHEEEGSAFRCSRCNSILEVVEDYSGISIKKSFLKKRISSRKYLPFLPLDNYLVRSDEGATALVKKKFKGTEVLLKLETKNPTKSFKDRGSSIEISKALEFGFRKVCCASTGNMGMSISRYAKVAGIQATVFMERSGNKNKMAKIKEYGARLIKVDGDFNDSMRAAEAFAKKNKAFVCGDYHFRKEGQKSLAFEIIDQLDGIAPDFIFIAVGNATLLAGIHKALKEYMNFGLINKYPRIVAVQSSQCNPLVRAYKSGQEVKRVVPRTFADAIAVGYPTFGFEGVRALKATRGIAISVSDKQIGDAVRHLKDIGISSEPGGAAGFAGYTRLLENGTLSGKKSVVIISGDN